MEVSRFTGNEGIVGDYVLVEPLIDKNSENGQ